MDTPRDANGNHHVHHRHHHSVHIEDVFGSSPDSDSHQGHVSGEGRSGSAPELEGEGGTSDWSALLEAERSKRRKVEQQLRSLQQEVEEQRWRWRQMLARERERVTKQVNELVLDKWMLARQLEKDRKEWKGQSERLLQSMREAQLQLEQGMAMAASPVSAAVEITSPPFAAFSPASLLPQSPSHSAPLLPSPALPATTRESFPTAFQL